MASIMQRAIDIDESHSTSQEERLNALLLENRGLKELLAVREQIHDEKTLPEVRFACERNSVILGKTSEINHHIIVEFENRSRQCRVLCVFKCFLPLSLFIWKK